MRPPSPRRTQGKWIGVSSFRLSNTECCGASLTNPQLPNGLRRRDLPGKVITLILMTFNAQLTVKLSVFSRLQSLITGLPGFAARMHQGNTSSSARYLPKIWINPHSWAKKPATVEGGAPSILEIRVRQGDSVSAALLQ